MAAKKTTSKKNVKDTNETLTETQEIQEQVKETKDIITALETELTKQIDDQINKLKEMFKGE